MTEQTRPLAVSGNQTSRKIQRPKVVEDRTGYSRVQIWRKSRDPNDDFPAPIVLGKNAIGFFEDEISAWLESRPRVNWAPAPSSETEFDTAASAPGADAA